MSRIDSWDSLLIHSDEGLKLETSVFESFAVANLPLSTLRLIIYFSVSLFHRRSTQFLLKVNSLWFDSWGPPFKKKSVLQ